MSVNANEFLEKCYNAAMRKASGKERPDSELLPSIKSHLDVIADNSESNKAVMTVVMTSLVYKILHPNQDIRLHQSSIPRGYSGRTFDTQYITPFLKSKRFPAMSTSGWLTRSLEQKVPYDRNYTGAIKPQNLKNAFLVVINDIETCGGMEMQMLDYLLQVLIIRRDSNLVKMARPRNLRIADIVTLLDQHFHASYHASGAARLPVLAIYAIYQSLIKEGVPRYYGKKLLPIESHTSADLRSGRIGDIDIVDAEKGLPFEAVEVKFDVKISHNIVVVAKEKIQTTTVERYYILSTKDIIPEDKGKIETEIKQIENTHGCQLVINGILPTLKYYLRLLKSTAMFIDHYAELLEADNALKFEHKQMWNHLVSNM